MERVDITEFEKKIMEGTDLKKHFTKDVVVGVNIANKKDKSDNSIKVIANIDSETKELLDYVSQVTGIKKGRIIENGIKLECKRLTGLMEIE